MAAFASITMVLMGRTGNGKSATGNSVLGKKVFVSKRSSSGVTSTSDLKTCVRKDGQVINVIDTPGIFGLSHGTEYIRREIMKCLDLVGEGIHAVLLVFSTNTRFTQEEEAALKTLQNLFGSKIVDYVIVVFTGGDEFDDGDTLEEYLFGCPVALKDIIAACKGRYILFDNKTKSETKKVEQVNKLLDLVNEVIDQNGGQAFTQSLFHSNKFDEKLEALKRKFENEIKEEREAKEKVKETLEEMEKQDGEIQKQHEDDIQKLTQLQLQLLEQQKTQQEEMLEKTDTTRKLEEKLEEMEKQHRDEIQNLTKKLDQIKIDNELEEKLLMMWDLWDCDHMYQ